MSLPITRQDLLDVLTRTMDGGWLDPLLDDEASAAVLGSIAEVLARTAEAGERACAQGLITEATGGSPGTSTAEISKASGAGGTLPKGTSLSDPRGVLAFTQADVTVGAGAASSVIVAETVRHCEPVNTVDDPGWRFEPVSQVSDATNATPIVVTTTVPHRYVTGDIVRVTGVLGNTAANGVFPVTVLSATTFSLTGSAGTGTYTGEGQVQLAPLRLVIGDAEPITGGTSDYLSAHGDERGVQRQANEGTYPYRLRVRNIPDAVSPVAVSQAVQGPAQESDLDPVTVRESHEAGLSAAVAARWNLASLNPLYASGVTPLPSPAVDFVDDAGREMVSLREATAYFRLEPRPNVADPDGLRVFMNALSFGDDPVAGYLEAVTAFHPTLSANLMSIWQAADSKRAAGVNFDVMMRYDVQYVGRGTTTLNADTTVVTLTPPAGKSWVLVDLLAGHDTASAAPGNPVNPATMYHRVKFTFQDASTFTTPAYTGFDTEHLFGQDLSTVPAYPGSRITQVEGIANSDGALALGVQLTLRVLEVTD